MKSRRRRELLWSLCLVLALSFSCDSNKYPLSGPRPPEAITPKANAEAELAALWLSGELIAPQPLYETIYADLAAIRTMYDGIIPATSIEFHPPWVPSQVIVGFTELGVRRLRAGAFAEFDELNDGFALTDLDTTRLSGPWTPWAVLTFDGLRHPDRMSDAYGELDHIEWADPNHYIGDWPNVYPWRISQARTYLFRDASGDCPAGCIENHFYYFRATDTTGGAFGSIDVEYVGAYHAGTEPEPSWWREARVAFYTYRGLAPPQ